MSTPFTTAIHAQGFSVTPAIREHVSRRLTVALERFSNQISQVDVFMKDLNGSGKGGEDQRVLVNVRISGQPDIVTETVSHDLYASISLAARRTRRVVRRAVKRHHRLDRQSIRQLCLPAPEAAEMVQG